MKVRVSRTWQLADGSVEMIVLEDETDDAAGFEMVAKWLSSELDAISLVVRPSQVEANTKAMLAEAKERAKL